MSAGLERSADLGAWSLAFQPIVELALGRTIGAEALLRWPDTNYGDVGPAGFLPVAEELGLSVSIGDWVSEELRRRCAEWREEGVLDDLRVLTFNVSPRELWHPSFLDRAVELADAIGREDLLVAEISEVALAMTPMKAKEVLTELRAAGVRVAIDGFGTGPSSLELLRELPVDIVKLDRGLVSGIDLDDRARALVRNVIDMCRDLELIAIAQGVERPAQVGLLVDEGCVLGQGFLLGPPTTPDIMTIRLRATAEMASTIVIDEEDTVVQLRHADRSARGRDEAAHHS